jgi:hypothetical protein
MATDNTEEHKPDRQTQVVQAGGWNAPNPESPLYEADTTLLKFSDLIKHRGLPPVAIEHLVGLLMNERMYRLVVVDAVAKYQVGQ